MARTERLVGRHLLSFYAAPGHPLPCRADASRGGEGMARRSPANPPGRTPGEGGNSNRPQDDGLGDAAQGPASRASAEAPGRRTRRQMPADALKCKECSETYPLDARYVCERCFGPLEVAYRPHAGSPDELRRRIQAGPHSLWRYADFLPLQPGTRSALPAGWTPLVRADRLARRLGIAELHIKNETANPTHSFKDRVVSIALARAQELGFDTVACASTGNLAGAVSAHAAAAGLPAYVFIPADLEEEKILNAGAYGSRIV